MPSKSAKAGAAKAAGGRKKGAPKKGASVVGISKGRGAAAKPATRSAVDQEKTARINSINVPKKSGRNTTDEKLSAPPTSKPAPRKAGVMTNIKANENDRPAVELPARTRSSARSSASRLSATAKNFVPQQGNHTLGWQGIDFEAGDGVIVAGDVDQEAAVSFDSSLRHVSFNEPAAAVEPALGADKKDDMLPDYDSDSENDAALEGPGARSAPSAPTVGDSLVLDQSLGHGLVEDADGQASEDDIGEHEDVEIRGFLEGNTNGQDSDVAQPGLRNQGGDGTGMASAKAPGKSRGAVSPSDGDGPPAKRPRAGQKGVLGTRAVRVGDFVTLAKPTNSAASGGVLADGRCGLVTEVYIRRNGGKQVKVDSCFSWPRGFNRTNFPAADLMWQHESSDVAREFVREEVAQDIAREERQRWEDEQAERKDSARDDATVRARGEGASGASNEQELREMEEKFGAGRDVSVRVEADEPSPPQNAAALWDDRSPPTAPFLERQSRRGSAGDRSGEKDAIRQVEKVSFDGRPRELALGLSYKPLDGRKFSEAEEKAIVAEQRRNIAVMSRLDGDRSKRMWTPNRSDKGGILTCPLSRLRFVDPVYVPGLDVIYSRGAIVRELSAQSLRLGLPMGEGVCPITARSMHVDHLVAALDLDKWIRKFESREKVVGNLPQSWSHYSFHCIDLQSGACQMELGVAAPTFTRLARITSPTGHRSFNLYNFTPPGFEPWALLRAATSFSGGAARYKSEMSPRWADNGFIKIGLLKQGLNDNGFIKIGLQKQGFAPKRAAGFSPPEKMHGSRAKWTHSPQASAGSPGQVAQLQSKIENQAWQIDAAIKDQERRRDRASRLDAEIAAAKERAEEEKAKRMQANSTATRLRAERGTAERELAEARARTSEAEQRNLRLDSMLQEQQKKILSIKDLQASLDQQAQELDTTRRREAEAVVQRDAALVERACAEQALASERSPDASVPTGGAAERMAAAPPTAGQGGARGRVEDLDDGLSLLGCVPLQPPQAVARPPLPGGPPPGMPLPLGMGQPPPFAARPGDQGLRQADFEFQNTQSLQHHLHQQQLQQQQQQDFFQKQLQQQAELVATAMNALSQRADGGARTTASAEGSLVLTSRADNAARTMVVLPDADAQKAEHEARILRYPPLVLHKLELERLVDAADDAYKARAENQCRELDDAYILAQMELVEFHKRPFSMTLQNEVPANMRMNLGKILLSVNDLASETATPILGPYHNQRESSNPFRAFTQASDIGIPTIMTADAFPFAPDVPLASTAKAVASVEIYRRQVSTLRANSRSAAAQPVSGREHLCCTEVEWKLLMEISSSRWLRDCAERYGAFELARGAMNSQQHRDFKRFAASTVQVAKTFVVLAAGTKARAYQALMLTVNSFTAAVEANSRCWSVLKADDVDGLAALIAGPAVPAAAAPVVSAALGQSISSMQADRKFIKSLVTKDADGKECQICINFNVGRTCTCVASMSNSRKHVCCYCAGAKLEAGESVDHACFDKQGKTICDRYLREEPEDAQKNAPPVPQ